MTVAELIETLAKLPPDADVWVFDLLHPCVDRIAVVG